MRLSVVWSLILELSEHEINCRGVAENWSKYRQKTNAARTRRWSVLSRNVESLNIRDIEKETS